MLIMGKYYIFKMFLILFHLLVFGCSLCLKKPVHTKSDANKACNLSFSSANLLFFLPNDKMSLWTSKKHLAMVKQLHSNALAMLWQDFQLIFFIK